MKPALPADVFLVVGAARRAVRAVLDTRRKTIVPEMLNSAGSVGAEWYLEAFWSEAAKRSRLDGISGVDVEFKQPATPADKQLFYALPHAENDDLMMDFHVLRAAAGTKRKVQVPVAQIRMHRRRRRRHGEAPDPPTHPYGIEIRRRHLNRARQVSWYTMVAVIMDVARRGAQFADSRADRFDPGLHLLYVVPRFSFMPLADATAQHNLFVFPAFEIDQPWGKGKTSAVAHVTLWAIANEAPWPIAESAVTVVRTCLINGARRPIDDNGKPLLKGLSPISGAP